MMRKRTEAKDKSQGPRTHCIQDMLTRLYNVDRNLLAAQFRVLMRVKSVSNLLRDRWKRRTYVVDDILLA